MNRKILSFIFGSLLVFSLFGAMEFQEVSAANTVIVKLTGPAYPTYSPLGYCKFRTGSTAVPYSPPGNVKLRFDVTVTYDSGQTFQSIDFEDTAGDYTIASIASHISGIDYPSGWTPSAIANGIRFTYSSAIQTTTATFYVRLQTVDVPDGEDTTWDISTDGGTGPHPVAVTATSTRDETPPSLKMKYTGITAPKVEEANFSDLLGKGTMNILMNVNEPVYATPTMYIRQSGITYPGTSLSLTAQTPIPSATWRSSTYTIQNTTYDGVAQVLPSVYDLAGNQADSSDILEANSSAQSDGPTFIVDTLCNAPSLTSPDDGSFTNSSQIIKLQWTAITEQASEYVTYNLQWAKNNTFTTELTSVSAQCNESSTDSSQIEWKIGTSIPPWSPTNAYMDGTTATYTWRGYNTSSIDVGTWYWRVKAIDALGNESTWSSYRSFSRSGTGTDAPTFRIRYIKTPKIDYNKTADVVGAGSLQIKIYASEVLKAAPTVQIKLHNQTTWSSVSVTPSGQASVYIATYNVPTASTNNGLAQVTVQGTGLGGNTGNEIELAKWSRTNPAISTELDSDGNTFYVDTATDSPSLYKPDNGYVLPGNANEANFTFYKISDLSAERPADLAQNNCITYHIQYSTSSTFSANVITQSIDVNESFSDGNESVFCYTTLDPYYKWYLKGGPGDPDWPDKPFVNLRKHKSQALSNGTWYWRVWATDRLGNQSPYSETRSFLVSATTPNLFSPTDLSLLITNDPVLKWYKVPSALFYNIRLSRGDTNFLDYTLYPDKIAVNNFLNASDWDNTNGNIMDYNVSVSTPPTPAIGRLEDGVWYWKVASSLDTVAYSETWRFTVDTTGPPAPNLITLTDGQVSQNKRPTFSWSAVSDANDLSNPVRYYIQISGNSSFPDSPGPANSSFSGTTPWPSSSFFNDWNSTTYQRGPLTTTSFVPSYDFPETLLIYQQQAYYWRVYVVDSAGNRGTNSLTRNFRISTSPPLVWGELDKTTCNTWPSDCLDEPRDKIALGLRSPSNGFTTNTRNPSLEWRHSRCDCVVREISSYIIEYSTDITFPAGKTTDVAGVFQVLGINPDNNLLINMGYTIQTPLYNGTYFWRVCAVDTAGNRTQFTAPWSFTVNVPDNEQPITAECSSTVPCGTGYTCQSGVCVPITYSAGNLTITVQNSSGTAISGATVTVDGTAQTTDATGKVTFASLSGGAHTINNVTASGYVDSGTSTVIVNGATAHTVTMTVPGTEGYVWGTVYFDQIGTPAPNIQIDIYNQSTDVKVFSGLTNSEGKYQSTALPGSGTYYLKIDSYEKELRNLTPTSLTTGAQDIILQTKGSVNGIVQDDSGQIVTGATVVLKKYSGDVFVDTKTTDRLGQFTFEALPGTYYITISKAGYDAYTSSSFTVPPSQSVNLQSVLGNIVLNALKGTLTVSVKNEAGSVINTATINIKTSGGSLVKSVSTVNGTASTQLAPGAYRVSAVSSGYAESLQQTTNITSNQTSSLSFSLAPATGSIRVVAKDSSGAPLGGASVYLDGELSGITDENGELLLTGLKLGTHTVRITKGGYTAVEEQATAGESTSVVDTVLPKSNLLLYIGAGIGLLIVAGLLYMKFGKPQGPRRPPSSGGLALQGRPGAPKLRPHRHKGGLPPSSIRVKKKNL